MLSILVWETPMLNVTCIVYNRIPKCGSTSVTSVIEAVTQHNNFTYVSSQEFNKHWLSNDREKVCVAHVAV